MCVCVCVEGKGDAYTVTLLFCYPEPKDLFEDFFFFFWIFFSLIFGIPCRDEGFDGVGGIRGGLPGLRLFDRYPVITG